MSTHNINWSLFPSIISTGHFIPYNINRSPYPLQHQQVTLSPTTSTGHFIPYNINRSLYPLQHQMVTLSPYNINRSLYPPTKSTGHYIPLQHQQVTLSPYNNNRSLYPPTTSTGHFIPYNLNWFLYPLQYQQGTT